MSSRLVKVIWACLLVLMVSVQALAICATHEQRVLIKELSVVALALAFAVALVQNKIKFVCTFPGLKRNKRTVKSRYRAGGVSAKSLTTAARASGPTFTVPANG
jgi:hypothetical protein